MATYRELPRFYFSLSFYPVSCASTVLAVCLSVRLSQDGVVQRYLYLGSH